MRESFKVNEQEYRAIQTLKRIHAKFNNKETLTDDEYNFLLANEASSFKSAKIRESDLSKENMAYQRKVQLRRNELQVKQLQREKEFKQICVKENKLVESHEGYADKVKPSFFVLNEIDLINLKIEELTEQNENIEKEMEKNG